MQHLDITQTQIKAFNNYELIASANTHLKKERMSFEHTNWHFHEIQNRKLFLELGYDSLAKMLIGHYGFCEFSAFQRVRVLNLVEEIPEIAASINSGELSLSNLDKAQSFIKLHEKKHQEILTSDEKLELIEKLKNKTTKEVKEYFAKIDPATSLPPDQIKYLNDTYVQITWTLEKDLLDKLDYLKSLISHENINPTNNELIKIMLTETIKNVEKKKGINEKPLRKEALVANSKSERSRYFSRPIKRMGFKKSNHQCEHIHANGKRCTSKFQLQFDHIKAFSKGGNSEASNIQVLCRVHNNYKGSN